MSPGTSASAARLAAIVMLVPFLAPAAYGASDSTPGELLVGFRAGARQTISVGRVVGSHAGLRAARVKLNPGQSVESAISELRRNPDVKYAEPNYIRHITASPNDPYFQSSQYGPQKIKADKAWDVWQPQTKVIVAIIDTGIEYTHPDLKNVLHRDASGNIIAYNALNKGTNANDDNGHGTHVAGIACGQINNGVGTAGIAAWNPAVANSGSFVRLMPVKALDANGSGSDSAIADGITWAADKGAKVINLSLGSTSYSNTINNAVQYAWNKGCVIAAAAGNESSSVTYYPAGCANVLSVGATDATDTLSYFSNHGSWVKVAAPGSAVNSAYKGAYKAMSGTSMATPHVAGEAAMLLSHSPSLTNSQVGNLITTNVDSYLPYLGRTFGANAGRINVQKAFQALGGQVYSLTASASTVTTGGPLSVSWTAPAGRPANDWVALFKVGDPNTVYSWWSYTNGTAAGSLNLTAPTEAGNYEFRYFLAGGYTETARSGQVRVDPPAPTYSVTALASTVVAGGALSVSWTAPAGRPSSDWIALFRVGDPNTAYGWWKYTAGAQTGSFALTAPTVTGTYEFRYLLNNGYTDSARSGAVTVSAASSDYSVSSDRSSVTPGGALTVSFTAPAGRPANDWIGLFKVGDPNTSYGWWRYTGGVTAGSFSLTAPSAPGQYEFRYLLNNGFTDSARSSPFSVGS